jgi:hypothetical protein
VGAVLDRRGRLLGDAHGARRVVDELAPVAEQAVLLLGDAKIAISSASFSGFSSARSFASEKSAATWYSSHLSWSKGSVTASSHGMRFAWIVTAFQPSTQIARLPNIS